MIKKYFGYMFTGVIIAFLVTVYFWLRVLWAIAQIPVTGAFSGTLLVVFIADILFAVGITILFKKVLSFFAKNQTIGKTLVGIFVASFSGSIFLVIAGRYLTMFDSRFYYTVSYVLSAFGDDVWRQVLLATLGGYLIGILLAFPRVSLSVKEVFALVKSAVVKKYLLKNLAFYTFALVVYFVAIFVLRINNVNIQENIVVYLFTFVPYVLYLRSEEKLSIPSKQSLVINTLFIVLSWLLYVLLHFVLGTIFNKLAFGVWFTPYSDYLNGKVVIFLANGVYVALIHFGVIRLAYILKEVGDE